MKNRFKRLIALLLTVVFVFMAMPTFAFAQTAVAEEEESADLETESGEEESLPPEGFKLLYDRNFSEGWPFTNGLSVSMKNQALTFDYERTYTGQYNYFGRFSALGSGDGYVQYSWGTTEAESLVTEFDIKADDYVDYSGYIYYIRTKGGNGPGAVFYLIGVSGNALYYYDYGYKAEKPGDAIPDPETGEPLTLQSVASGAKGVKIGDLSNEWIKLSILFDYSTGGIRGKEFTCTISWQKADGTTGSHSQLLRSNISWAVDEDGEYILENGECVDTNKLSPKADFFRMGYAGAPSATCYGTSYCIDNLRIYEGSTEQFMTIDEKWGLKNGTSVKSDMKPTIEILGKENLDVVSSTVIAMKVGVDYCLNNNKREPIFSKMEGDEEIAYGAPRKIDGKVYVPLMRLLDATGLPYYVHKDGQSIDITTGQSVSYITIGSNIASVNGEKVFLTAAPGYYEDDNGNKFLMFAMDDIESLLSGWYITYDDLGLIIFATTDNYYDRENDLAEMRDMMGEFVFEYKTGEEVYEDAKVNTNNFDHPYLLADQDMFDTLRSVYLAEEGSPEYDATVLRGITKIISNAETYYKRWATPSDITYNDNGKEVKIYDEYVGLLTDREMDDKQLMFRKTVSFGDTDIHLGYSLYQPYIYAGADAVQRAVDRGNDPNAAYVIGDGGWITGYDNDEYVEYTYNDKVYSGYGHFFTFEGYERCIATDYNGYDPEGGRTKIDSLTEYIATMALAYQITRDDKYLLCGYDALLRLGQWTNWAPGHFLDCATGTLQASCFYDWGYDRINELGAMGVTSVIDGQPLSTETIAKIIYTHGIYAGYRAVTGQGVPPKANRAQGNITSFRSQYNNWNAVCSSGMAAGVFALMDYAAPELDGVLQLDVNNPDSESTALKNNVSAQIRELFVRCFKGITSVGLDQYAPDGSYSEGVGYWNFGTGRVFVWGELLMTVCGTDYGMFNAPGLDMTCQYAYSACSSDFISFPYSDGSMGRLTFTHFYFAGQQLGQQELIDIRTAQLEQFPETMGRFDLFFYPLGTVAKLPDTLDYYSAGVDMFTTRSSWESSALYTGVIGGKNKTADHNQIDAGHFIYYNEKVTWFIDIGCESYNVYGYGNVEYKYRYYRSKPEGHNTICITTDQKNVPFGQVYDSEARAYEVMIEDNPHGSYAKFDMTETLGPQCNYWKRGILLTNDRQTTVIQDEISLNTTSNLYWFAHFSYNELVDEYILESDGKTVYLINYGAQTGKGASGNYDKEDDIWMRATLVANSSKLKFEVWDAYTYVHSSVQSAGESENKFGVDRFTHKANYNANYYTFVGGESVANGGRHETGRDGIRKLVVRAEQDISFEMAVVIEMVDRDPAARYTVGYEWQYMDGSATYGPWAPTADNRFKADYVPESDALDRTTYKLSMFRDISKYLAMVTRAENVDIYLTTNYEEFYRFLASAKYLSVKYKEQIATVDTYKESNQAFLQVIEIFDMYRNEIVSVANSRDAVCESLLGVTITD